MSFKKKFSPLQRNLVNLFSEMTQKTKGQELF